MRTILIIVCFFALNSAIAQTAYVAASEKLKKIENGLVEFSAIESIIKPDKYDSPNKKTIAERMAALKVPGVSIAIFDEKGIIYPMTFGILKEGSDARVTDKTIFQAASTSKLITSLIVLHYIQNKLLDLDEDVNKYLKRWRVPDNELTKRSKVTLRLLLTHQSGLPATNFMVDKTGAVPTLLNVIKGESPAINKPAIPVIVPGTQWEYSNIGYVLIQLVLEDITGKPFPEIAREVVFKPLKMRSSTFIYPLNKELGKREAMPHDENGKFAEPAMDRYAVAHGGLMTTPADLALFTMEIINAYRGKSAKIINKEFARKLLHKELDLDPKMFGLPIVEGLGVMLMYNGNNTLFTHPGSNFPGSNCWLIASSQTGKGAIVMTNGAGGEILEIEIITAISKEFEW